MAGGTVCTDTVNDDELPIPLGPCSNGEYDPLPMAPVLREAERRALETCVADAERLRIPRRRFLRSLCAAATTLAVLDACTREEHRARPSRQTSGPGGGFEVPPRRAPSPRRPRRPSAARNS